MQRAAVLSILKTGQQYTIWLESPHTEQASIPVYTLQRDLQRDLDDDIEQAIDLLRYRHARQQGVPSPTPAVPTLTAFESEDPLRRLGRQLFRALPPPVRAALQLLERDNRALIIATNDHALPWELIHTDRHFMALAHPVGRRLMEPFQPYQDEAREPERVWQPQTPLPSGDVEQTTSVRALFIADPTGDLEAAVGEVEALANLFERQLGSHPPRILCHRRATRKAVLAALSGGAYDLIHYAGHAFFDPLDPEASGLILHGGEVLRAHEIQAQLRGRPIVFLNGCESARRGSVPTDTLAYAGLTARGLASAFIQGGARGFVGALWVTYDEGSRQIARRFYRRALKGETIGEALRWARVKSREETPDDPTWASFALYGPPTLRLVEIKRGLIKPISVLSIRIRGASALYDQLGLEAASDLVGRYLRHIRGEITAHHGEMLSLTHDTLTATFGASVTREDHAELAIRTALAVREMAKSAIHRDEFPDLALSIGVDAGDALVRTIGPIGEEKTLVLGPPIEQAQALRDQARENQILLGPQAYQETASEFNFALPDEGPPGPGDDRPVHRVLGIRHKREQILDFAEPRTQMVGREEELAALQACWNHCCEGHRQIVGIAGDAGVGKSRLLHELARRVNNPDKERPNDGTAPAWLLGICQPHGQGTPYAWLAQIVQDLFEIDPGDEPSLATRKLSGALKRWGLREGDLAEPLSILGDVLGLEDREGELSPYTPQIRQGRLVHYLKGLLAYQAKRRPVVIVIEDAHWIDDASLDVIQRSVDELSDAPILLLTLYRPERIFGWENKRYYRSIPLDGLTRDQAEALLAQLLDASTLPPEVTQPILAKVGGNPFFLEEIVASLKETGVLLKSDRGWRIPSTLTATQVPASIRGILLARIDRLPPRDRQVLQAASVVGHDFPRRILAEIFDVDDVAEEADLSASLTELKQRELIDETSPPLTSRRLWRYAFRHNLTQEVAYNSLPIAQRQHYHRHIGAFIERLGQDVEGLYPQQRAGYAGLLAHHRYRSVATPDEAGCLTQVTASDQAELAKIAASLVEAGAQAKRRYANREAIAFYQQALSVIAGLPDENPAQQVVCFEGLGDVHSVLGEFDLAIEAYQRAFCLLTEGERGKSDEDATGRLRAANVAGRIGRIYERKGGQENLDQALKWRDEGLALLPGGASAEAALLHALGGIVSFRQADFDGANRQLERSLSLAREANAKRELRLAHTMLGMSHHAQGHLDRAMAHCQHSITLDRELSDLIGLAKDYSNRGAYAFEMDDWPLARESYHNAFEILECIDDRYQLAITSCNLADLHCHLGELEQGLAYARRGLALFEALTSHQGAILARAVLATLHWRMGNLGQAQTHLLAAREMEDTHDVDMFRPTIGRWLAQVYLTAGNVEQAGAEIDDLLALDVDVLADEAEPIQHLHGQILAARGERIEAVQVLYASLARLEEKGMRYQTGGALLALAGVLADHEERSTEAIAHARRARDIFASLGATPDAQNTERLIAKLRAGKS